VLGLPRRGLLVDRNDTASIRPFWRQSPGGGQAVRHQTLEVAAGLALETACCRWRRLDPCRGSGPLARARPFKKPGPVQGELPEGAASFDGGSQLPTPALVEADHVSGSAKQGDALTSICRSCSSTKSHQLLAQPARLVGGMTRHIPRPWPPSTPVAGCSGQAHQLRQAWIVPPRAPPAAKLCSKRLRTRRPGARRSNRRHRKPLEFEQSISLSQAQDELKLRIGRGADPEREP